MYWLSRSSMARVVECSGSAGGEVVVAVKVQGPPSCAKMLMPEMVPAATPNVIGRFPRVRVLGSATLGTQWVRRPVGATGLIDGRHVALGPGDKSRWVASAAGGSWT
ncbi:hypothetical protein TIFTF001_027155 [Ficus carica]|uniref:Uncharacterized protein n=1 Tax=Ficus carica TaxID=3494 RepID=A0AA88DNN3_FICCA|nr:hypothetical protein TIFTF001_027155 [Ficus carica]